MIIGIALLLPDEKCDLEIGNSTLLKQIIDFQKIWSNNCISIQLFIGKDNFYECYLERGEISEEDILVHGMLINDKCIVVSLVLVITDIRI